MHFHNNFDFTFQLTAVGLIENIRTKVFLEHKETLLYPMVLELSMFGIKLPKTCSVR